MPPRNLASVLDDVIDSANFIAVRRNQLTLIMKQCGILPYASFQICLLMR
jgi:hypothetical protein